MARKTRPPRKSDAPLKKELEEKQTGTEFGLSEDLQPEEVFISEYTDLTPEGEKAAETQSATLIDLAEKLIEAREKNATPMGESTTYKHVNFTEFDAQKRQLEKDIEVLQNGIQALLKGDLKTIPKEFQTPQPVRKARIYNPQSGQWEMKQNPVYEAQMKLIRFGQELAAAEWSLRDLENFRFEAAGKSALDVFKTGTTQPKRDIKQAKDWQNIWNQRFSTKTKEVDLDSENGVRKMFKTLSLVMGSSPKLEKIKPEEIITLSAGTMVHTPYGLFKTKEEMTTKGFGNTLASELDPKYESTNLKVHRYIVTEQVKGNTIRYLMEETV